MSEIIDSKTEHGHETIPPYCGAFPERYNVVAAVNKYRIPLSMIQFVHDRGSRKYPEYSWIMNPNAPNSSVEDNINALYRHFVAHSMGQVMDPEGLPHIFHMACRAGMLVTKFYRNQAKFLTDYASLGVAHKYINSIGSQITPEEIAALSCAQVIDGHIPAGLAKLQPFIMQLLLEISLNISKLEEESEVTIHPLQHLNNAIVQLFIAVMRYCDISFTLNGSWPQRFTEMDPIVHYTAEDKTFLMQNLDITLS